ncbi:hypothetical protein OBBRIDRAFT_94327 [Obba rivulosa]|uniref:Uncharacterized protein n=1 Tax=Obba rivulosa TaxID=1052685 RepID=A0A8E2DIJ7_9APHY|nr:hypothetical protein OBBRIDRAFT_94327 [Obba rivulosa]
MYINPDSLFACWKIPALRIPLCCAGPYYVRSVAVASAKQYTMRMLYPPFCFLPAVPDLSLTHLFGIYVPYAGFLIHFRKLRLSTGLVDYVAHASVLCNVLESARRRPSMSVRRDRCRHRSHSIPNLSHLAAMFSHYITYVIVPATFHVAVRDPTPLNDTRDSA